MKYSICYNTVIKPVNLLSKEELIMFKKIMAILLAGMMALSLAACGGDQGSGTSESAVNTFIDAEPTTLDPSLRSDSYSSEILTSVMEGLIRIEQRDGRYEIMPGDAESWTPSEDGTVWTFHIGADRKWSDGEPVTAEQYVYSLQRSADPATGCPNSYFVLPIKNAKSIQDGTAKPEDLGVKAIDSQTLEITLEAAKPSFLESTDASIFYPERQDIVEAYGEQFGTDADKMVYNGPFVVSEWTHNSQIVLSKNEQYWDKDNVSLSNVNYQIITDYSTISTAYQSGQIDQVSAWSQEEMDLYNGDDSSNYTKISGGTITFQFYNTSDKMFSNKNIRKAFSMAIDQEDVNQMAFGGLREPLYGWIAPAISVGDTSMRSVAGDVLREQKEEMTGEGKSAKDVLIEGMQELGLGSDPSTLDVTYSLAGTDEWYHTFGEYLQQVFKEELGIDLKIDFSEWGIFSDNLAKGKYQIGFMSWGAYYNDPYDMLSLNLSDQNSLSTGWSNTDYDKLCLEGESEMDEAKRMDDYVKAERILLDDYVVCPFATSVSHMFTKTYVQDKYAPYGSDRLYFIHPGWKNVYIEQ